MKRLFLLLLVPLLVFLTSPPVEAQNLTAESLSVKKENPKIFKTLKESAEEQWGENYFMVVSEINQQVAAIVYLDQNVDFNKPDQNKIFANAFNQWKRESYNSLTDNPYEIKCNWVMVKSQFNQQFLAKNQLDK